ncbi:MAG: hypothetical protein HN544_07215 [Euryarchaeota archaeon]|nr:hypothetical protein [Euryarchaeota archaeon]
MEVQKFSLKKLINCLNRLQFQKMDCLLIGQKNSGNTTAINTFRCKIPLTNRIKSNGYTTYIHATGYSRLYSHLVDSIWAPIND